MNQEVISNQGQGIQASPPQNLLFSNKIILESNAHKEQEQSQHQQMQLYQLQKNSSDLTKSFAQNQNLHQRQMKFSASCKNQLNQAIRISSESDEDEEDDLNFQNNNYFQRRFLPARSSDILQTVFKVEDKEKQNTTQSQKFLLAQNYEWSQQYSQNEQRLLQTYQNNINIFNQNRNPSISVLFENEVINSRITESRSNHNKSQNTPKSVFKNFQDCDFGVMSVEIANKNKYRDFHKLERQLNFNNKILNDKTNSFHFKRSQESRLQNYNINQQNITQNTQKQEQTPKKIAQNLVKSQSSLNLSPQVNSHLEENNQFCNLNQAIFSSIKNTKSNIHQDNPQKMQQFSSPQYQKQISYIQGIRKMSMEYLKKTQEKSIQKILENNFADNQQNIEQINKKDHQDINDDLQQSIELQDQKCINLQNISSQTQCQSINQISKQTYQNYFNVSQAKSNKQQGIQHPQKYIQNYQQQQQALQFYHQQYNKVNLNKMLSKKVDEQNRHQFIMQYETIMNQFYGKKEQKGSSLQPAVQKQIIDSQNQNQKQDLKHTNLLETNQQIQQQANQKSVRIQNFQQQDIVLPQNNHDKLNLQKNFNQLIYQSSQNPLEQAKDCGKTPKIKPKLIRNELFDLSLNSDFSLQSQKSLVSSVKNSKSKNIRTIFSVIKTNSSKGDKKIEYYNLQQIFKQNQTMKQNKSQGLLITQNKNETDSFNNNFDSNNILVDDQFLQENQLKSTQNKLYKNQYHSNSINNNSKKIKQMDKLSVTQSNLGAKQSQCCQTDMESAQEKYLLNSPGRNQNLTDRSPNQVITQQRLYTENQSKSNNLSEMIINSTFMNGSNFTVINLQSKKDQKSQLNEDSNLLNHLENRFNRKQSFLQSNLKLITSQTSYSPSNANIISKFSNNKINSKLNQSQKNNINYQIKESLSQNNMISQANKNHINLSPKNQSQEDLQKNQKNFSQKFLSNGDKNKNNSLYLNKFSQILNSINANAESQAKNVYIENVLDQKQQQNQQQQLNKRQVKELQLSLLSKTEQQLQHS
ncbi:hypothetical protein TTHERM_01020750 (macronuclear) [Tetrahymena thermophila SB210]|uniref:Uncharacterized protein n=1 Tax=Tetrahymena thermophila (strain SB210) TaxID=312017 RepID=Q24BZ5_TETTS|nr:hypothetical protein TTHERM_01020750 [Tetrahymena thermophila SB210]EAS05307.2 hypothetical protein TTHERM_01020750 [Tetrahymena thermophila SB210]|eukprot:XP_001025552.2 hypothetical protein TTHERM_01020750 [Tetrahymena thermophila SB210]